MAGYYCFISYWIPENYQAALFKENESGQFDIIDDTDTGQVRKKKRDICTLLKIRGDIGEVFFWFLHENICCGYALGASVRLF